MKLAKITPYPPGKYCYPPGSLYQKSLTSFLHKLSGYIYAIRRVHRPGKPIPAGYHSLPAR